ncbi:4889_t:CDS:1, partial [Ambispora leptoticha]
GIEDGNALACRRKQWIDKIKLMIMMRDEINPLIKEYRNADDRDLIKLAYTESK